MSEVKAPETVEARIRELLEQNFGIEEGASGSEPLADQGFDSLDEAEFALNLEEEFAISIPEEDEDQLLTIQQAVAYISKRQSQ